LLIALTEISRAKAPNDSPNSPLKSVCVAREIGIKWVDASASSLYSAEAVVIALQAGYMVQATAGRQSQDVVVVQYSSLVSSAENQQVTNGEQSKLAQQIKQV